VRPEKQSLAVATAGFTKYQSQIALFYSRKCEADAGYPLLANGGAEFRIAMPERSAQLALLPDSIRDNPNDTH